jgi:hypothetical protein
MAQFKDLLVFGTTRVLDNVYAKKFIGDIEGNADTATKALQDYSGQVITSTYIKNASASGTTLTFTKGDGSTFTITTQDTHVDVVDDVLTADATKALSANQGVVLAGRIADLEEAATWTQQT